MEIETLKSNTQIELKLMELEARANEASMKEIPEEDNSLEVAKLEHTINKDLEETSLKRKQFQETVRATIVKEKQKEEEIAIKKKQANKPKTSK